MTRPSTLPPADPAAGISHPAIRAALSALLFAFLMAVPAPGAGSGETRATLAGPVEAHLLKVVDGDTLSVRIAIWPGQTVETLVRLDGVDAPEIKGRCDRERELASAARDFLRDLLGPGPVMLSDVRFGKYAGRVLARVATADGRDVANLLVERGLGRLYDGGRRQGWCG